MPQHVIERALRTSEEYLFNPPMPPRYRAHYAGDEKDGEEREKETEARMVDRYTKIVLTIIAISLCALVLQNMVQPVGALGSTCGTSKNPCHVTGEVTVTPRFMPAK